MHRVLRVNNTLDHNHEIVIDASLNFSGRNPDVRSPVLYRPISLAGQNTGHEMDQWRKTLYTSSVSDGRHASVSSVSRDLTFIIQSHGDLRILHPLTDVLLIFITACI